MSPRASRGPASGRTVVGAFAGLVAAIAAGLTVYAGFGMPGMDHGDHPSARTPQQAAVVSPREFAHLIDEPDTVTVNVHIPFEGTIPGTDLHIDYRSVASDPQLARADATTIAIYCQSGNMSTTARATLRQAGYDNVVELSGGMNAWARSGRPLLDSPGPGPARH